MDKIEDSDTRKGIKTFVDYNLIGGLLRNKREEEALALIRKSDLPVTLRARFLTSVGALVVKNDRTRAIELLNEALTDARRLEQTSD